MPSPTLAPSEGPKATVRIAVTQIEELPGMPFVAAYGGQWTVNSLGINETLFVKRENDLMSAQLGTRWELAPDFSSATISVRAGVPWWSPVGMGKDFGEFSAEDAVWFLNRANATTNPESSYKFAGTLAGAVSRAELVDRTTFKLYPSQGTKFSVITLQDILSEWAHGSEMFSQRVFDEMGVEWAARNPVGTGPMRLVEWVVNDHGTVEATPSHYLHPSRHVMRLSQVQVPENASRVAMLKTGEVDAISVPIVFVEELEREGFKFLNPMDQLTTSSLIIPGNLWEEVHAITGEPLEPWKSPVYAQDYPHIGNPWGDRAPYVDNDNPQGVSDMEQARLVRQALSLAMDRDGMIDSLWGGRGYPIPIEYVGPEFEAWESNRCASRQKLDDVLASYGWQDFPTYGVTGPYDSECWPWATEYDPARAEEILDTVGYPRKGGVRFEMTIDAYLAGELGGVPFEAADAIATMWEAIGVRTTILREDYGAVISPRMRKREQFWPVPKNCDVEETSYPADWPLPVSDTSITRPGWGCGFEDPFLAQMNFKIKDEAERARRVEMHKQVLDWMVYWRLYIGIVELPTSGFMVNPNKITDWTSRQRSFGSTEMWSIVTSQ